MTADMLAALPFVSLLLAVVGIAKALTILARTEWWALTRLRFADAVRAWRGEDRTCALCDDPIHTCVRCTDLLRGALRPEPYDQSKETR